MQNVRLPQNNRTNGTHPKQERARNEDPTLSPHVWPPTNQIAPTVASNNNAPNRAHPKHQRTFAERNHTLTHTSNIMGGLLSRILGGFKRESRILVRVQ